MVLGTLGHELTDGRVDDPLNHVLVCGVFDGHRTSHASEFAAANWIPTLRTSLAAAVTHTLVAGEAASPSPTTTNDPAARGRLQGWRPGEAEELIVTNAWRRLCDDFLASDKVGGATATTAMVWGDRVTVTNCGDSRAILTSHSLTFGEGGEPSGFSSSYKATRDHRVDDPEEIERITAAGGSVGCENGAFRVKIGEWRLAVPRCLGDREWAEGGVSNAADTYTWALDDEPPSPADVDADGRTGQLCAPGPSLVVATDGVWGVLTNEDVTRLVSRQRMKQAGAAATSDAIIAAAQKAGGRDNLCAVVVYLK